MGQPMESDGRRPGANPIDNIVRTADFWRRATGIYASYKVAQLRALVLRATGKDEQTIKQSVWDQQHVYAGEEMYKLCVSLRGFYLKAGQFIGSRSDFVPEQICRKLTLLCDKVPPMSADKARKILQQELGVTDLSEVFEWIDMEKPVGSASISQVHKAQLKCFNRQELRAAKRVIKQQFINHVVQQDQGAWDVCNFRGIALRELQLLNRGIDLDNLAAGTVLKVPAHLTLDSYSSQPSKGSSSSSSSSSSSPPHSAAQSAVLHAVAAREAPRDGHVAVKIQYPDALPIMMLDLKNVRAAAYYLSKTELKFDLVSAVDELNKQIKLEFDFTREARVMDTIAHHLRGINKRLVIPRSIGGLVTERVLVMHFLEGTPLTEAASHISDLSARKRETAKRRILNRVSEAYGRMILGEGLFQADGHPGNILISKGAKVGLLDYGQSKQLPDQHRVAFAKLVMALHRGNKVKISEALGELGVTTEKQDPNIRSEMAYGMFDTRGKVDPFDPKSPLKQSAIDKFPQDMFFVLRVVQLLRGLSNGMGIHDFSSANQWVPFARDTLRQAKRQGRRGLRHFLWPLPIALPPMVGWWS